LGELGERQERFLRRVLRSQRPIAAIGLVVALIGAAYGFWGVLQFEPVGPPADAFDRPIARMGRLFERYQRALDNAPISTELERFLIGELRLRTDMTASVVVLLLRLLVATIVLTAGLVMLTVNVERQRLLALISTLRE
jgi:uncharacterized membrane protein YphA (DoxX/SURF4 family)